jgi:hypothetical protein
MLALGAEGGIRIAVGYSQKCGDCGGKFSKIGKSVENQPTCGKSIFNYLNMLSYLRRLGTEPGFRQAYSMA